MSKRKRFIRGKQCVIIQMVLLLVMISICGCGRKTELQRVSESIHEESGRNREGQRVNFTERSREDVSI